MVSIEGDVRRDERSGTNRTGQRPVGIEEIDLRGSPVFHAVGPRDGDRPVAVRHDALGPYLPRLPLLLLNRSRKSEVAVRRVQANIVVGRIYKVNVAVVKGPNQLVAYESDLRGFLADWFGSSKGLPG